MVPTHGAALPKEHAKFIQSVLRHMVKLKDASIFLEPVDPVKLQIPTYFDVVKRPMDLSTMDKKLKDGQYSDIQQFNADMELMFENCYKFNGISGHIADMTTNVKKSFHKQLERLPKLVCIFAPPEFVRL